MRKIHRPHFLVVNAVDRKIRKHASIGELASSQVNFPPHVFIVNVVLSPFLFPVSGLKSYRKSTGHLDGIDYGQTRRSFLIEES